MARRFLVKNNALILMMLFCFTILGGCAGVTQGRPAKVIYQDAIVNSLIDKYSKSDAIFTNQSSITVNKRNQTLDDLIYLTDVNYYNFETELYHGRAFFDTSGDLAILGLGAAGGLVMHSATQAILAAISAGIGGSRVSISKNYFHEFSTQALIAKMQSTRKVKLEFIRKAMALSVTDYSLSRGLSDLAEYYNAGTIVGALQNIVADAGSDAKKADDELKNIIEVKYAQDSTRPIRDRINRWLDSNLSKNIPILKGWFQKQSPSIILSPSTWVDSSTTTQEMLNKAIKENNIPEG
jgi:hypothetical protein